MTWEISEEKATVTVKGNESEVDAGTEFGATIFHLAKKYGVKKFDVELNGENIDGNEAPAEFSAGDEVIIKPTKALG